MVRKLVCALFVMVVGVGFVVAETRQGLISNIKDNTFEFQPTKKGQADGDKVKLTLAKDGKVVKGVVKDKKAEPGEAIPDGLKNELFTKGGDKGTPATVTYEGTSASQIMVVGKKKKTE